ncbi:MAG TPA: transglutaminaseTgpA domain-containing protein, partial [Acidothermaceae bacterium]
MTDHDLVVRRFDLAARISLLAAGLAAQGAMWVAGPSRAYLAGAILLIGVSADAARRPLTRFVASPVASRRRFTDRQVLAGRVVAGVVLVEICMGVVGALHVADGHAMGTPLGVLLLAVQIAYAGAVESRRDLKLGCAIVVVLLVQAGAFTTTSAVRLPMVASLVLLLIATALLQRATALELVDSITLPGRAPLLRSFVGPVAGAAMLGVVAFLVVPNSLDLGIVTRVHTPSVHAAGNAGGAPAGVGTRAEVDAGGATVDLRVRGALPTAPIFVVAATTPAYWQGAVFDHFDGTTWTSTSSAVSAAAASSNTSDSTTGVNAPRRTDVVDVVSIAALDVVLAPGTVTEYHGPGQVRTDTFGTTRLSLGPANGERYQVESTSSDGVSASQLRAVAAAGASAAANDGLPQWRQVPADLPARVHALAVSVAGAAPTRYDAVTAIDTYLQTHETYDLDSPRPAAGVDAVDDFLFVSGRGFCEQFASAAVVMLRSLGIPTRLVTGFVQGDVSSFPGQRIMRGSDAHAWIQVWYPGVGWVSSDPTAGSVATGA